MPWGAESRWLRTRSFLEDLLDEFGPEPGQSVLGNHKRELIALVNSCQVPFVGS